LDSVVPGLNHLTFSLSQLDVGKYILVWNIRPNLLAHSPFV
jgi:hypothetical protein